MKLFSNAEKTIKIIVYISGTIYRPTDLLNIVIGKRHFSIDISIWLKSLQWPYIAASTAVDYLK